MRLLALLVAGLLALAAPASAQLLGRQWGRFLPRSSSYAIAPDGSTVTVSDWDGLTQGLDQDGRVLWRVRFPAPVLCALSAGGQVTACFTPRSERDRTLILLNRRGDIIFSHVLPGPALSVRISRDGRTVAALSRPNRVTVFTEQGGRWRWRRRTLTGVVSALAMDARGRKILVSRAAPDGLALLTPRLKTLWHWNGLPRHAYRPLMDTTGRVVTALAVPPPGGVPHVLAWDTQSPRPVWKQTLRGDLARIGLASDGRYMAASYRTRLWFRRKTSVEFRVMLFSPQGRRLWEVGGLMFGAQLIGATPAPLLVLTHDNGRVLAALDTYGHMRARYRLGSPIQSTQMSADGSHFLVMTDDQVLHLFRSRE